MAAIIELTVTGAYPLFNNSFRHSIVLSFVTSLLPSQLKKCRTSRKYFSMVPADRSFSSRYFLNSVHSWILILRFSISIISPFYFAVAAKILVDGLLRGSGAMVAFTTSTFIDLILRVILAYIFAGMLGSETGIWLSWPFGWTIATCVTLAFYFKGGW